MPGAAVALLRCNNGARLRISSPSSAALPRHRRASALTSCHQARKDQFKEIPDAGKRARVSSPEDALRVAAVMGFGGGSGGKLPTQGDALVAGISDDDVVGTQVLERKSSGGDVDYLQELIAIQQSGPKALGFFGTRNMGFLHQQLIEILSYAMVLTGNHIFTSGATGTNAAVIRGALRAENQELLTVVLPQSLSRQPQESQELLQQVQNVIEMPDNDDMALGEASRICNRDILGRVQQVICFAFHDSRLLLETCRLGKEMRKIVTLFYLD
mmetsp:Transcript_33450/g.59847  ORF Transcript_33450/g.59847 Transcript_33450/m.59847 type:complete len:271 (-) Transcript_33450:882-1694(-)